MKTNKLLVLGLSILLLAGCGTKTVSSSSSPSNNSSGSVPNSSQNGSSESQNSTSSQQGSSENSSSEVSSEISQEPVHEHSYDHNGFCECGDTKKKTVTEDEYLEAFNKTNTVTKQTRTYSSIENKDAYPEYDEYIKVGNIEYTYFDYEEDGENVKNYIYMVQEGPNADGNYTVESIEYNKDFKEFFGKKFIIGYNRFDSYYDDLCYDYSNLKSNYSSLTYDENSKSYKAESCEYIFEEGTEYEYIATYSNLEIHFVDGLLTKISYDTIDNDESIVIELYYDPIDLTLPEYYAIDGDLNIELYSKNDQQLGVIYGSSKNVIVSGKITADGVEKVIGSQYLKANFTHYISIYKVDIAGEISVDDQELDLIKNLYINCGTLRKTLYNGSKVYRSEKEGVSYLVTTYNDINEDGNAELLNLEYDENQLLIGVSFEIDGAKYEFSSYYRD